MYNGRRMEEHGFGISLNIRRATAFDVHKAITNVLNDPSYRQKTQKASGIMQGRSMLPRDLGAQWIEHVLEHGGDHLRPHAQDMPAYQLLMLDIVAFICGCVVCVLIIIRCSYNRVKACFTQKPKKKTH